MRRRIKEGKLRQNKTKSLMKKNDLKFKRNMLINDQNIYIFLPTKQSKKNTLKRQKIWLILAGIVMGFLNGFFGGGGGMVCVPILQKVLKLDAKHSHATAIMIIFPLSLISSFIYVFNGYISSFPLLTVGLGVVVGGIVGAFALKFLPPKAVRVIFAVIMFAGGVKLII